MQRLKTYELFNNLFKRKPKPVDPIINTNPDGSNIKVPSVINKKKPKLSIRKSDLRWPLSESILSLCDNRSNGDFIYFHTIREYSSANWERHIKDYFYSTVKKYLHDSNPDRDMFDRRYSLSDEPYNFYKRYNIIIPQKIQDEINKFGLQVGVAAKTKNESLVGKEGEVVRIRDIRPIIISDGTYINERSYCTVVFNTENTSGDKRFYLLTDFELQPIDINTLQFSEDIKEIIEDYLLGMSETGSITFCLMIVNPGEINAYIKLDINIQPTEEDEILDVLAGLKAIKSRLSKLEGLKFETTSISKTQVSAKITRIID